MSDPSNSELGAWDDASLVVALFDRIWPRYEQHGLESLNEHERVVLAVYCLDNEACNGGFGQWLDHVAGDLASATPACLEAIGDPKVAELARRVLAQFGDEGPSPDYWERMDQIESLSGKGDETIGRCDVEFGDLEKAMHERLCTYARTHLTEIRLPESNLYQPPQTESTSLGASTQLDRQRRSWLVWLLLPALIGGVVGSLVLAPFVRSPGDPFGHSIGAGLGGLIVLGVGVLLRSGVPRSRC